MKKDQYRSLIYLFFILSGATGLIYQVSWFKYLSLFLGNTTYAQTIVLATFLGGLAIGNYFIGKKIDYIKNQLFVYGLIELIIGVYCLVFPNIISIGETIFYLLSSEELLVNNQIIYLLIKFIISTLVLILPTILMGGTLPTLTKYFTEKIESIRKENGSLYFLNSFGAVVGVFFAGFILIKNFGIDTTILIAAILNLFIGSISIVLSSIKVKDDSSEISKEEPFTKDKFISEVNISERLIKILILIAGLSGFSSLAYEVLWTKILISIFGSSTYSFSLMLIAFISGITIGSFIVSSNLISKFNPIKLVIYSQFFIALTIAFSLFIIPFLPYQFWKTSTLFSKTDDAFSLFLLFEFIILFFLMFIPTIFMGMTLPLIVEIVARYKNLIGRSVGTVFSVNTTGNVLGSLMTGLVLIPLFGIKDSFVISILINILGIILILSNYLHLIRLKTKILYSISLIFLIIIIFNIPDANKEINTLGVFRRLNDIPPPSYNDYKKIFQLRDVLFYKEGTSSNVAVTETKDSIRQRILIINGKPDASSVGDLPTQYLLGHIPMMLHPRPEQVFVIGYGSGSTISAVLNHNPQKVICAEISKEVLETSELFSDVNENCIKDPRLQVIIEDAQSYLKLSQQKFDVIISEPSNPWIAGIGNLFSKEYFERCKNSLKKNGVMTQWFHIYEMDDDVLSIVISTFYSVFPYVQIWGGVEGDLILIGSNEVIKLDDQIFLKKLSNEKIKRSLSRISINSPFTFLTTQILSPENSFTLAYKKDINSEKKPLLEFLAPVALFKGTTSILAYKFDEKFDTLSNGLLVKEYIKKNQISNSDIEDAINFHLRHSMNYRFAYGLARLLYEKDNSNSFAAGIKSQLEDKLNIIKYNTSDLIINHQKFPQSQKLAENFANQILSENINSTNFMKIFPISQAESILIKYHNIDPLSDFKLYSQLAVVSLQNSEYKKAFDYCIRAEKIFQQNPDLFNQSDLSEYFYTFALSAIYLNEYGKVVEYFIQLVNYNQNYPSKKFLSKRIEWRVNQEKRLTEKSKSG